MCGVSFSVLPAIVSPANAGNHLLPPEINSYLRHRSSEKLVAGFIRFREDVNINIDPCVESEKSLRVLKYSKCIAVFRQVRHETRTRRLVRI